MMALPWGVRMDSGWNCTPSVGWVAWCRPIGIPPGPRAVTIRSAAACPRPRSARGTARRGRAARTRRYCRLCAPSPPGIVSGRSPIVSGVAPPRRQAARPGAGRTGRAAVRQPRSGPSPADGMPPGTEAEPAVPFLAVVSGSRACRAISGTRPFAGRRAGSCSRCAIGRRATGPGIRCHGRAGSPEPRSWCG